MDNYILRLKCLLGKQTDEARVKYMKALISFQRHKSTIEILPIPNTGKLDNCSILTEVTLQNMKQLILLEKCVYLCRSAHQSNK